MIVKEYKTVRYEMIVDYENKKFIPTLNSISMPTSIKKIKDKTSETKKFNIRLEILEYQRANEFNELDNIMQYYLNEILRKKLFKKLEIGK
jgi:hypothetical protein